MLLTDGSETDGPYLTSRIHNEVTNRGVRVDTIAFGQEATTRLEELSQATSGSSYYASLPESGILASENTNPLEDAFNAHLQNLNLVQLVSNQTDLFVDDDRNYTFIVDYTANTEAKLTFNYDPLSIGTNKNYVPTFSVYGLDNELLCDSKTESLYQDDRIRVTLKKNIMIRNILVKISGKLKPGMYRINIRNNDKREMKGTLTVVSFPAPGVKPLLLDITSVIKPESQDELTIYVKLGQGEFPCLGATVVCEVTRPLNEQLVTGTERAAEDTVFVKLYDNGLGDDVMVDDGIYTGNFRKATFNGKYPVKCFAKTTTKNKNMVTYISNNHLIGNGRIDKNYEALNPKEISFNRFNTHLNPKAIYVLNANSFCKTGYTNYGDSCYKIGRPTTYTKAKESCKSDGGGLVRITSFNEMRFLFKNILPLNAGEFWLDRMSTSLKDEVSTIVALTGRSSRVFLPWSDISGRSLMVDGSKKYNVFKKKTEGGVKNRYSKNYVNLDRIEPDIIRQQYANLKTGLAKLKRRVINNDRKKRKRRKRRSYDHSELEDNSFLRAADNTQCSYLVVNPKNTKDNMVFVPEETCKQKKLHYICEISTDDVVAPNKIVDFVATPKVPPAGQDPNSTIVQLSFTSPGDDINEGTVAGYKLYYTGTLKGMDELRNGKKESLRLMDISKTSLSEPNEAGLKESTQLNFEALRECPGHNLMDVVFMLNIAGSGRTVMKPDQVARIAAVWTQLNLNFNPSFYETQFALYVSHNRTVKEMSPLGQYNNNDMSFQELFKSYNGFKDNMTKGAYDHERVLQNSTYSAFTDVSPYTSI